MIERPLWKYWWYNAFRRFLYVNGVIAYRLRCTGRENIPKQGAALLVSNHQSHFDPPLLGCTCPRRMNFLARKSLFAHAPFRMAIQSLDAIPIDRDGFGLNGIKESLRRLKHGEMVVIFPEGTRTRDGEIGHMRPGFTMLAARSSAVILPVAIEGAYQVWPRWRSLPRPFGRIHVHYGPPILPSEIQGRDEQELLAEVDRRVRQCQSVARQYLASSGGAAQAADRG